MEKLRQTSKSILSSSFEDKRSSISDVLSKAESSGIHSKLRRNLRRYLDSTATKPYSLTLHLEKVQDWDGILSSWNQFATHPKTGAKTFVQPCYFYTNEDAACVTAQQNAVNNQAIAANREADDHNQRIGTVRDPEEIDKIIHSYNKLAELSRNRISRRLNAKMRLSSSAFDKSSFDMFSGVFRGNDGRRD